MNPVRRRVGALVVALARRRVRVWIAASKFDARVVAPFLKRQIYRAYDLLVDLEQRWL